MVYSPELPSPDEARLPGAAAPRLSLGTRIVVGVALGVLVILLLFGAVAWAILNQAVDAAADEQVVVATAEASQISAALAADQRPIASAVLRDQLQRLVSRTTPPQLSVQVITTSGEVLAQIGDVSPTMIAEHVVLLQSFIATAQTGYRVHRPGPGESFTPHIVAYAPVPGQPNLGVFVQQTQATILDAPEELLRWLFIAGLAALALAVAIAWLDVNRVIRPLRTLTAAAERFAAGELSEPITIDRGDEVGTLANSLETMRQRLRQSLAEIESWNQELEQRVERRTRDLEQRNRQLSAINVVAENLSDPLRVVAMLERTLPLISEATGFEAISYRLLTDEGTLPLCTAYHLPPILVTETVRRGRCLCGQAVDLGRPVCGSARDPGADACRLAGMASSVAIPLRSVNRVEGVLFLGSAKAWQITTADLETLGAIGRQVGMAIANARLYTALQQRERERAQLLGQVIVAQEEERRRLAAELHDDLSQALTLILLGLEGLPTADQTAPRARATLDHLRSLVTTTLETVHNLAAELRPSLLDDLGMVAALERLVEDYRRQFGLSIEFQTVNVEKLRLLPPAETALYRIAQAALNNVARHAAAKTVSVLLQRRDDRLILVVEDDGRGFDLATVRAAPLKDRLGLAGIEERAQLIGAQLTIESSPGHGTTLFVDVPILDNLESGSEAASGASRLSQ